MDIGMLWFDNDKQTDFQEKVERATRYYQKRYGVLPDLCFVHPRMLPTEIPTNTGVEIRTSYTILPGHFWIGRRETSTAQEVP